MEDIRPRSAVLRQALEKTESQKQPQPAMLTVAEACAYLRISKWSLYQLIRQDKLKSVKIGRRRLVPLSSIEHFIKQLQAEAEGGG
jgi:excisionase family DNA binding protein